MGRIAKRNAFRHRVQIVQVEHRSNLQICCALNGLGENFNFYFSPWCFFSSSNKIAGSTSLKLWLRVAWAPKSDDFFLFPNWGRLKKMTDNFLDRKWPPPPHTHTHTLLVKVNKFIRICGHRILLLAQLWLAWVDLSRTHSALRGSLCLANIHHILGSSSKSSKEL